ncbi:MAG: efflux RND transporter periplasmic adaptor subunit [Hyphomicrobiales bacterium]|uniref:efflux RND transporter periplasmic adaptor subunit n=1 Tax=Rhabdaerophilum calidifontis TaxID=2604328 RepID=UPI00123A41A1|nr:efflux RND transporter periplasmic adaptor subunit [Rhabdaerophilum calidifontis]MCA1952322.1 efflux RND transporter periplasmic adaptor subunit [Hyphomicrobiales bacterium]
MEYGHQRQRLACGAAFLAATALTACQEQARTPESPPTMVAVETVVLADYAPVIRLTGEIRARVESDLSFRVAGRISERLANVGDRVSAEDVLARLDPEQQRASVTAAEATVTSAEAVLRQATSSYARQKALLVRGFTTQREHDQAEEAYRRAEAALADAKAQLGTARDHLADTVLRAGISGVITARNAEMAQVVQAAQTVFTIAEDGPRDAVFNVDETIFTKELANPAIALTLVSDPSVTATGSVRQIAPTIDRGTGTVRVKVGIDKAPAAMPLGAAVIGTGRLASRRRIAIPWSALSGANGRPGVWVVDPRTKAVSLQPIVVEAYETGTVFVREGIRPGDMVVTAGAQFLRPRQVVALAGEAAR